VLSTLLSCTNARAQVELVLSASGFKGKGFISRVLESLAPLTFERFITTRRYRSDLGEALRDKCLKGDPGFTYCDDSCWIVINKNSKPVTFSCTIANTESCSLDLSVVERELWDFVKK
jgi:hypothetical protein